MLKKIVKVGLLVAAMVLAVPAESEAAKSPKLSSTKLTVAVGKSKVIRVTNTKKKVKWRNSAKSVVKVKKVGARKAKITAKKKGSAKITAVVGGKKKLTCRITVKEKKSTGVILTPKESDGSTDNAAETDTGDKTEMPLSTFFAPYMENAALKDGDDISITVSGESLETGYAEKSAYSIGITVGSVQDVSFDITDNSTADGKPAIEVSFINHDIYGGSDYFVLRITAMRPGTANLTVNVPGETATFHVTTSGTYGTRMNYADVLLAMMETPLGETAVVNLIGDCLATTTVTIDGEDTVYENSSTVTVDGVKGENDQKTLLNLGAWIADNKSYRYGDEDDVDDTPHASYFFFREWWFGGDCGGLNTILEDAATLLGYTAWQGLLSVGQYTAHAITNAVIDGKAWSLDAGGVGGAGERGFSSGSTTLNENGGYAGPALACNYAGTMPNRRWEVFYFNRSENDELERISSETVTALAETTLGL